MIKSIFQLRSYVGISCVLALSACEHLKQDVKSVEASYQKSASDTVIYTNVVQVLQNIRRDLPSEARLIVLQGRVLMVGYVANAQEHIDVVNAIWKIKGVQEVIDHLEHVPANEKTGFDLKNAFVKTQLDTMFLTNSVVHYGNFQYVIFKKNLYVLARTSSETEKEAFYAIVKKTPTLQKVYFYSTLRQ
jgi:hypothetical protein